MARRLLEKGQTMRISSLSRMAARSHSRAFTLVEMMIVVAIVGVLAVIAVVSYRKLTLNAKISEAQNMISAIRIAEEDYKVERGTYADVGPGFCPSNGTLPVKTMWNPGCPGLGALPNWAAL